MNGKLYRLERQSLRVAVWVMFCLAWVEQARGAGDLDWRIAGGDAASSQYSPLAQIHRGNVAGLKVAWRYQTGDARGEGRSQIQCSPIIVGRVLYGTSPQLKLFALDAATGEERWVFDPFESAGQGKALGVNRGVVYWQDGRGENRRILFTAGRKLFAVDAETGRLLTEFGRRGVVDLGEGLGRDVSNLYLLSNSPGAVFEDLLVLGTRVSEGPGPSAPGHIRAWHALTGKLMWVFRTIPHPGEFGHDTWPADAWQRSGGANAWSGITVDNQRGLVFCPTGSPSFDFWGGDRHGRNLFGNCLLALNARTGERVWHYQFVRHDLWDRDLPAPPNLVTLKRNGEEVDAVAQVTKSGHVFVFDRESGLPLFPIEEVPAPASDLEGEAAWPTQPLPLKPPPFSRQKFTEGMATRISPKSHEYVVQRLKEVRTGRQFIPPSLSGTVIFPGFDGGGEWGGAAWDPEEGVLFVNGNEMPWILTMVKVNSEKDEPLSLGEIVYRRNCAACHGVSRQGDPQRNVASLQDIKQRMNPKDALAVLNDGKGNMPAFGFLSAKEKNAVTDFLYGKESKTAAPTKQSKKQRRNLAVPYAHTGYNRFFDPEGYPAVETPWGTLNAIDLNRGELLWQVVLGEFPELTQRGIPPTGTENYGGPIVTGGGLVFIGATKDERFRAFDKSNGKILFETNLPAGGYATPATYAVDGRQFVVIACGGGKMGTKSGDSYLAFALPLPSPNNF